MKTEAFEGKSAEMKKDTPWLASEDLLDAGDVKVTIEGVFRHTDAEFESGRKELVYGLRFVGRSKQLILNATNRKTCVSKFGTGKVKEWVGKEVVLYVDPNVRKPGTRNEKTCGIRIRP
jgi:hypothetical protein